MANFDRVAPLYKWLEYGAHGHGLETVRFHYLPALTQCRSVLIVGDGDGRFLERLLTVAPDAHIHSIDASAGMIALARQRLGATVRPRVRFEHADVRDVRLTPDAYDLIVTMFVLDCFSDAAAATVAKQLGEALRPGGLWLFADYVLPERGWRRSRAIGWLWVLYTFFGVTAGLEPRRLPPSEAILGALNLVIEDAMTFDLGLLRAVLYRKPIAI